MKCPYAFIVDVKGKYHSKEFVPWDMIPGVLVPCGKCIVCRQNRSAEWSARLVHESQYWEKKCFITLTYNNDNVPIVIDEKNSQGILTLNKTDYQKFIKRLGEEYGMC